jgi:hypothetical protein
LRFGLPVQVLVIADGTKPDFLARTTYEALCLRRDPPSGKTCGWAQTVNGEGIGQRQINTFEAVVAG